MKLEIRTVDDLVPGGCIPGGEDHSVHLDEPPVCGLDGQVG